MKLRLGLVTFIAATTLSFAAFAGNTAFVIQEGGHNSSSIYQDGHRNTAMVYQEGYSNHSYINQDGHHNLAGVYQAGDWNHSKIVQTP